MFSLRKVTPLGRKGLLSTPHGDIDTPCFLPVATAGAMKGLSHADLLRAGAQILLCNTYHLHLQPGEDIVREAGGLHAFIGWEKPILTDSGGFQVFSLRQSARVSEDGVHFRSHLNGDPLFLGPEEAMRIQHALGADIIMCFDECPPSTAKRSEIEHAVNHTLRWAKECRRWHEALKTSSASSDSFPLLFGIVQGGVERDLREKCAQELIAMGFDGYAIGGLAVGESEEHMYSVLASVCPLLPEDRPRYLMGVGDITQMQRAVAAGIDMFDCVLPVREARHGTLFLSNGSVIRIIASRYRNDHSVVDPDSPSALSRQHTKSYLCHLLRARERYGETIACMQNLSVTLSVLQQLRCEMESSRRS